MLTSAKRFVQSFLPQRVPGWRLCLNNIAPPKFPLGVLAGGGAFPRLVAEAASAQGRSVFVVVLEGHAHPADFAAFPHVVARIGSAGLIRSALRNHGVQDVVMIGAVRRPALRELRPDRLGALILARIGRAAFAGGDDRLLAAAARVMADEGFRVIGAHDILPSTLLPEGVLTRARPDDAAQADIVRGTDVARALGRADAGQACVIQAGLVLALEGIEGTDAMILRTGPLARPGPGGVLVKCVKPQQDRRLDLPAIGPGTVRAATAAGLRGIAAEAGATLLADAPETVALADKAGLFLLGFAPHELPESP